MTDFSGYYTLTTGEFDRLWDNAIFSLDTSSLLALYRGSAKTSDETLDLLEAIKDRLWFTNQVATEYHVNLASVVSAIEHAAEKIEKTISDRYDELFSTIGNIPHPFLRESILASIRAEEKKYLDLLAQAKKDDQTRLRPKMKELRQKLRVLLTGRTGAPFSEKELEDLYSTGKARYAKGIPPGFADSEKPEPGRYGDFIVWEELIRQAKSAERPIVLVTEDRKPDWWLLVGGKNLGPHPKLRTEFLERSGQWFYLYETSQFLEFGIPKYRKRPPNKEAIRDAEISQKAEQEARFREAIERQRPDSSLFARVLSEFQRREQLRSSEETPALMDTLRLFTQRTPTPEEKQLADFVLALQRKTPTAEEKRLADFMLALQQKTPTPEQRRLAEILGLMAPISAAPEPISLSQISGKARPDRKKQPAQSQGPDESPQPEGQAGPKKSRPSTPEEARGED